MKKTVLLLATVAMALGGLTGCDPGPGYHGVCKGADALTGVTIVIDFRELDGNGGAAAPTITRCSPNPNPGTPRTGIEALQDAGIDVKGTTRWGLGFVCRLKLRPGPDESLPVSGSTGYREACVNTPPGGAYWSYWHADGSGRDWQYSSFGAFNRNVVPGGFEGWSFALNAGPTTNPKPEVAPYNPAVDPDAAVVSLSVNDLDATITLGQTASLTWTTTNASSLRASSVTPATGGGTWSGTLGLNGSRTVTPTARGTYTYAVTAVGVNGSVAATTTLRVT